VHNYKSSGFKRVIPVLSCFIFISFVAGCGDLQNTVGSNAVSGIASASPKTAIASLSADEKTSKPWAETGATSISSVAESLNPAIEEGSTQASIDLTAAVTSNVLRTNTANALAKESSLAAPSSNSSNTLTVNSANGQTYTNVPLQIGRVFRQGEVAGCPRANLDGVPIEAQFDVKNRYADGTLKFATVSMLLNKIDKQQSTLSFVANEPCSAKESFNISAQLASLPNLDVSIRLNGNDGNAVSLRSMLLAGKFSVWENGPIATSLIVADHTTKAFDFGVDSYKSLRPIFHVKFWKRSNLVTVRVIVEQSDTQKMQAQNYSLEIFGGLNSRELLYSKPSVNQHFASRWTKEFSLGTAAPIVNVNHNIGYLASTKAIPNFDSQVKLANSSKEFMLSRWDAVSTKEKDLFGAGMYQKYMQGTGGRPEIGMFTDWASYALFDGDARLWNMLKKHTDLAASFPMHFREGDSNRKFMSFPSQQAGIGLPITRDGRKAFFLYDGNGYFGRFPLSAVDEPILVGPKTTNDWVADCSHQPDDHYPLYLTTGEYWYLEQLQFWASWGLFSNNPLYGPSNRVVEDAELDNQLRGEAWCLRTRARSAFISVDGSAEQQYFTRVTNSALRAFEGIKLGPGGTDPVRARWAMNGFKGTNPLFSWKWQPVVVKPDTYETTSTWQHAFMVMSLGHVGELGFNTAELLNYSSKLLISMGTTPGVNPEHLSDYQTPITRNVAGYPFFQNWTDSFANWSDWQSQWKNFQTDLVHGYPNLVNAAASFITKEPGGSALWKYVYDNNYSTRPWDQNPKWAVLPR
jgi:hypothetical protein